MGIESKTVRRNLDKAGALPALPLITPLQFMDQNLMKTKCCQREFLGRSRPVVNTL